MHCAHADAAPSFTTDALTPVESALDDWFAALERRALPILALRGARRAPLFREGGDLDLACLPRHRRDVERALRKRLRAYGVTVVSERREWSMTQWQLYAPCGPGLHHHLCVDLHTRETCFGVPFLTAERLFEGRSQERRPQRPAAVPGALLNFLTPYLSGPEVRSEYATRLAVVAEKNPAQFRAVVGDLVGTRRADRFLAALRSTSLADLAHAARPFRRALLARAFIEHPVRSAIGFATCFWSARIAPLARPRGRTVALLGTDGSGKTTLAESLHEELAGSFRSTNNRTIKLRPGLLPQLGRLLGRQPTDEEYARPHRAKPSGTVGTWFRAAYYWLDYTVGYAVRVLPLRRRNTLLVFDRWADDWLIDPARYRMRANSQVVRMFAKLTPRPDVVLVTTAPLRTVRERKREVGPRECLRQLAAYEAYALAGPNRFLVSTAGSARDALDSALLALFRQSQAAIGGTPAAPRVDLAPQPEDAISRSAA